MKRLVTFLTSALVIGCATVQSGDRLKIAALHSIGLERVAWISKNTAALPRGMESVVDLKEMRAFVDRVSVDGSNGTVKATYWYTGTFSTPEGERNGTVTIQRRLHFTRDDSGKWTESAPAEEIARNSSWSAGRQAS